jgi:hypothetical protein
MIEAAILDQVRCKLGLGAQGIPVTDNGCETIEKFR